jgi:nucleoid DNA-binding protein
MRKPEIARSIARRAHVSHAEAADRLDGLVNRILAGLRHGRETALPGLGRFTPGPEGQIAFEAEGRSSRD